MQCVCCVLFLNVLSMRGFQFKSWLSEKKWKPESTLSQVEQQK